MTPEQRLDRLERIAKLFVRAGQRGRTSVREQHEKINILIDTQNQNEDRFNERFARIEEGFAMNEVRFARTEHAIDRLIAAQARTEEKLQALIDAIRQKGLGDSFA
jgi:K+/H+ antiporter YhaU regulatory subunit KhtT